MKTPTNSFDAVAEARRWKAAVSQKSEGMNREQVLAFFDKGKALTALAHMRQAAPIRTEAHA